MKKNLGMVFVSLFLLTGLTGCNGDSWEYDKANHWHETGGDDKQDFGLHTFKKDEASCKDATCTEKGLIVEKCTECGYTRETYTPMLPHEFVKDPINSKDPTCLEEGKFVEKCSHCSETREELLPKTPHSWVEVAGEELTTESGKTVKKWKCKCGTYSYTMDVYDFDFLSPGSNAYGVDGFTPGTDKDNANGIRIAGNGSVYWNFPIVAEGKCQISIGANPAPSSITGTLIEQKNGVKVNDTDQTLIPKGAYKDLSITTGKFDELLLAEFTSTSDMVGKEAKIEITQKPSSRLYFGGVVRVTIIPQK